MKVDGPRHYLVANCDVLLAEAAFLQNDPNAALEHARSALDILRDRVRALNANNAPQTFPAPQALPDAIYWKVRAQR